MQAPGISAGNAILPFGLVLTCREKYTVRGLYNMFKYIQRNIDY
jgi:hypothetical protein